MVSLDPQLRTIFTDAGYQVRSVTNNTSLGDLQVETDKETFFVKLRGEYEKMQAEMLSLQHMHKAAPGICPKPLGCGKLSDGNPYFISEQVRMGGLTAANQAALGQRLAEMHAHNSKRPDPITEFGFDVNTWCGLEHLDNSWKTNYVDFYANNRILSVCERIAKKRNDPEVGEMGQKIAREVVPLLCGSHDIKPALLHGDLWSGNASCNSATGTPIIFDPCSFYGHNEAELGMMRMFGGFTSACFEAYHKIIPKLEPYYDQRQNLYQLYHELNHALIFGGSYRSTAMRSMQSLLKFAKSARM